MTVRVAAFDAGPIPDAVEGGDMLYSSGTSGRPKGIKPRMTGLPLGSSMIVADLARRDFGCGPDTVYLSPAPFYHAAPMRWTQAIVSLGGTAVLMKRFDAEAALAALERYRVTHSQWVPTMFHRLLALPEDVRRRHDLSSHRVAIHAAAPCPVHTKHAMIDWWGPIITEYYGCSESIGMTMTDSAAWLAHPGTVGRPIYGVLHILDEDGRELPAGEEGTVYFSDTAPFSYHNDPERSSYAFTVLSDLELARWERDTVEGADVFGTNRFCLEVEGSRTGNFARYLNHAGAEDANVRHRYILMEDGTIKIGL